MPSDVRSSAPGLYSNQRIVAGNVLYTSTTVDLDTLAVGDIVEKVWCEVVTAFNAGTTNTINVGDGTTANKYLAAANVTAGTPGVYPPTMVIPFKAETAAGTLRVTFAQTGTAATAGAAVVYAKIVSKPL